MENEYSNNAAVSIKSTMSFSNYLQVTNNKAEESKVVLDTNSRFVNIRKRENKQFEQPALNKISEEIDTSKGEKRPIDIFAEKFSDYTLTAYDLTILDDYFQSLFLKRNAHFKKDGKHCGKVGILIEGAAYSYIIDENGEEVIQHLFHPEGANILFDYESFIQRKKSYLNIKCYEDSFLLWVNAREMKRLYRKHPQFYVTELRTVNKLLLQSLQRSNILQIKNAIQRIKILQEQDPTLFKLFPFSHIASYLGMHRNTFTRSFSKLK